MGSRNPSSRYWCFTINNPTETEIDSIKRCTDWKYVVFAMEKGESGTPHLQGYVVWASNKRLSGCRRVVGFERAHFEKRAGSEQQAIDYCFKDEGTEGWWSFEEDRRQQGKRSDLDDAIQALKEGGIKRVRDEHPKEYIKYWRGFHKLDTPMIEARNTKPYVVWLYGPTGIGKTRYVFDHWDQKDIFTKDLDKWWDGYRGQKVVLFDDFRGNIPYATLLRVLDRYQYTVDIKNGSQELNSPFIYITSSKPPHEIYTNDKIQECIGQLYRRIDSVRTFERGEDGITHDVEMKETFKEILGLSDDPPATVPTFMNENADDYVNNLLE